jgi:hypothetical protein
MVFENRALRNISQPKKVEVKESLKKLHEDMICTPPNIILLITLKTVK